MNEAIIESIEWHKEQLFKLLEDDDLYKIEGIISSVKTDLDEIIEKAKSKKKVWVKPTATKKGHYREQEVGRKAKEQKLESKWGYRPESEVKGFANEVSEKDIVNYFGHEYRIKEIDPVGRLIVLDGGRGDSKKVKFGEFNRGAKASNPDAKSKFENIERETKRTLEWRKTVEKKN